jgi:alpha-galactosidase
VALFNRGASRAQVSIKWSELGLEGRHNARDLWNKADLPNSTDSYTLEVPAHGSVLLKLTQ